MNVEISHRKKPHLISSGTLLGTTFHVDSFNSPRNRVVSSSTQKPSINSHPLAQSLQVRRSSTNGNQKPDWSPALMAKWNRTPSFQRTWYMHQNGCWAGWVKVSLTADAISHDWYMLSLFNTQCRHHYTGKYCGNDRDPSRGWRLPKTTSIVEGWRQYRSWDIWIGHIEESSQIWTGSRLYHVRTFFFSSSQHTKSKTWICSAWWWGWRLI